MKKALICLAALSFMSVVSANECTTVYLSVHRKIELKAALEVQSYFKNTLKVELINSIEVPLYQTVENNSSSLLEDSSTVIVFNEETDMTGSEVKIEAFKTDENGKVRFSGSQMVSTKIAKSKKLVELAKSAISFSCGQSI